MALLMLDLDNTLVDRDAAFGEAVAAFLAEHRLPAADLEWVREIDVGGYGPRDEVVGALTGRYGDRVPAGAVEALVDDGGAERVVLTDDTREALEKARADGWTCVIVTNGPTVQQETKIRHSGLDRLVRGWVISEEAGCKKPDEAIFRAAADVAGVPLDGAWMVGDSAHADIAGAHALGLRSVWVANGRTWAAQSGYRPTHIAEDVATAIACAGKNEGTSADG